MDGVAGVGIERQVRAGQLEGTRLEAADVSNPGIRTLGVWQTGAPGSEEELILGGQTWVAAQSQEDGSRRVLHAVHIRRRQSRVELLIRHVGAAEEFAPVGRGNNLVLMGLGEIWTGGSVSVDDPFGQEVLYTFILVPRHVGGEKVIETAIFTDDDDDVLNGTGSPTTALRISVLVLGVAYWRGQQERKSDERNTDDAAAQSLFPICFEWEHSLSSGRGS